MSQTLEAIKGGGGSVKVGSTGTISSLITRELESVKSVPQTPIPRTFPVSDTPKRPQPRKLSEKATSFNHRNSETRQKTKGYARKAHRAPILGSDSSKKGSNMVEIVDIKCGNPVGSMATRLKKLGFTKLSESII